MSGPPNFDGHRTDGNWPVSPPVNLEAEQRVLGTLLVFYKPQLVHVVQAAGVKWMDFYREQHRIIYRAIVRMHSDGEFVDDVTVARFLECQRHQTRGTWLEAAGGRGTLELLQCGACVNGLREYALIVAEDGRWRRWLNAMFDALESIGLRDEPSFWSALARVREDVTPVGLTVVDGEKAA